VLNGCPFKSTDDDRELQLVVAIENENEQKCSALFITFPGTSSFPSPAVIQCSTVSITSTTSPLSLTLPEVVFEGGDRNGSTTSTTTSTTTTTTAPTDQRLRRSSSTSPLSASSSSHYPSALVPKNPQNPQNQQNSPNPYSFRLNKFHLSSGHNAQTKKQFSVVEPQPSTSAAAAQNDDPSYNLLDSILEPEPYFNMLAEDDRYQAKAAENKAENTAAKKQPDVRVTIYHHQGIHDPVEEYGKGGPWNFLGNGYGVHYEHDLDGKYSRQKGYNFVKAHGREFCKEGESGCENQKKAASEKNVKQKEPSALQKHIYSVLKNDNFNVKDFFGKEGEDPAKEAERALVDEPREEQQTSAPQYAYATDKRSPVLSRLPTSAAANVYLGWW
ncbi:hypothetical protein TYRP_006694, partial [Tyrophagus putrescentiae]